MTSWIDRGTYWLNSAPQGTPIWHGAREFRLTASNFACAAGWTMNKCTPDELADDITGIKKREFTDEAKVVMKIGTETEPIARQWYERSRGVHVQEVGLAVPKWNTRIGASLDGEVGKDGAIEIKCPLEMYKPLLAYMERVNQGWKPPRFFHDHIWPSHLAQMQGGMAITSKSWCDYIVYCPIRDGSLRRPNQDKVFVGRLEFDPVYWNQLHRQINTFIQTKLDPRILKLGLKIPNGLLGIPSPLAQRETEAEN